MGMNTPPNQSGMGMSMNQPKTGGGMNNPNVKPKKKKKKFWGAAAKVIGAGAIGGIKALAD